MIPISKIDENLSIYKENKVIICGNLEQTKLITDLFIRHEIEIFATNTTFTELDTYDGFVIQLATNDIDTINSIPTNANVVTFEEAMQVINFIDKLQLITQLPQILVKQQSDTQKLKDNQTKLIQNNIRNAKENPVLLCLPPKTGDHTLMATFDKINQPYHILWHTPSMFKKDEFSNLDKTFKIITAVRDPIARDISSLYQGLEFIVASPMIDKLNLQNISPHIMAKGGDAQTVFDMQFNSKDGAVPITEFMGNFKDNILDLLSYPFDTDLGYTIIKEGNIEVFIYQLEKLDSLTTIMSDWLEIPIDSFVYGNVNSNKWISNSYNLAKEKFTINSDYLEKSYSSDWVKHFYSTEDIEKFKAKWDR